MKKRFILYLLLLGVWLQSAIAQTGIINKGAYIEVKAGATVTADNSAGYTQKSGTDEGGFILAGTLNLTGNFLNNSAALLNLGTGGQINFRGTSLQVLGGNSAISMYNLTLNNSAGLSMSNHVTMMNQITFGLGKLQLNQYNLNIGSATLFNPSSISYIIADSTGTLTFDIASGLSKVLPVGNASSFLPVVFKNNDATDAFSIRIKNLVQNNGLSGSLLSSHILKHSYFVTEGSPLNSNVDITLQWNSGNEYADFDRSTSGIAYYSNTSSQWMPQLSGLANGFDPYLRSRQSIMLEAGTNVLAVGDKNSPFADGTPPTLPVVQLYSNNGFTHLAKVGDSVYIYMESDEALFAPPTVKFFFNGQQSVQSPVVMQVGVNKFRAQVLATAAELDGTVSFQINFQDIYRNPGLAVSATTNKSRVWFDKTKPLVSDIFIASNNVNYNYLARTGNTATLQFTVNEGTALIPVVAMGVASGNVSKTGLYTFTAAYAVNAATNDGVLPFNILVTDSAGNISNAYTAITKGRNVIVDKVQPSIISATIYSSNAVDTIATVNDIVKLDLVASETLEAAPSVSMFIGGNPVTGVITVSPTDSSKVYSFQYQVRATDTDGVVSFSANYDDLANNAGPIVNSVTDLSVVKVDINMPTADLSGENEICADDSARIQFDFTGDMPFSFSFTNGVTNWNITGVAAMNYVFYAKDAGSYRVTQLVDATGNKSVDLGGILNVIVNPLPTPSFSTAFATYSVLDPFEVLTGTPVGGVFSGPGIISTTNTFYPEIAGPNDAHTLVYTYTDANGCTYADSVVVKVIDGEGDISNLQRTYCYTDVPDTITGVNTKSIIGTFRISGGKGLIDNGDNTAKLIPSEIGAGTDTIYFTYFDGIYFNVRRLVTIDSVSTAITFSGLDPSYCADDDNVTLVPRNLFPAGGEGKWNGPNPVFPNIGNSVTFRPGLFPLDVTYDIEYIYISPSGCSSDTITQSFIVHSLPVLDFTLNDNYNEAGGPIALTALPSGGTFTGTGVTANIFYPSLAGVGTGKVIQYEYTDIFSCTNRTTDTTVVRRAAGNLFDFQNTYCFGGKNDTISGFPESDGIGVNFRSTKNAVSPLTSNTAIYSPVLAGAGTDTIYFDYTIAGTPYTVSQTVFIDSIGVVDFGTLNAAYCAGDQDVTLFPSVKHTGGSGNFTFTGNASAFVNNGTNAIFKPLISIASASPYTITYTYTSAISGCKASVNKKVTVNPLPVIDFNLQQNYNITGSPDFLESNPTGGVFSGNGVSNGYFYPNLVGIGENWAVTYTYVNPVTTCKNSLTKTTNVLEAQAQILGVDVNNIYCVDGVADTLTGTSNNGLPNGVFEGKGITNIGNDQAIFNPAIAGSGIHEVVYKYFGTDGVTLFDVAVKLNVDSVPQPSIIGLDDNVCVDASNKLVFGSPQNSNGAFFGPGVSDLGNGTATFSPSAASIGEWQVKYVYTNPLTGCFNTDTKVVFVHELPIADFSISDECIADSIQFTDMSTCPDPVVFWEWIFGDNDNLAQNESNLQNPKHWYTTPGTKQIKLKVTSSIGCASQVNDIIELGSKPTADFTWTNECFGTGPTSYINLSYGATNLAYKWDLGDGTVVTTKDPVYQYGQVGAYNVSLVITTPSNCTDTSIQLVYLRPYVTDFPYAQDFENGPEGWLPESADTINSWELGTPRGLIINSAASGVNAYITGLATSYNNSENSYVVGPCFDFTSLQRPIIKLNVWSVTDKDFDGAVLQSSIDNGKTWRIVGSLNSGVNWYNSFSVAGRPGGSSQGWSGETHKFWVEARHGLDDLKGATNVRFRIAFGSDANYTDEGFAFDDIYIGERSRMVLLEHFTNTSNISSVVIDKNVNTILSTNSQDVVSIQMHTSFPSNQDPLYLFNPAPPSARSAYYGISVIPYSVMDGNRYFNYTDEALSDTSIKVRALKDPQFKISMNPVISNNNLINIDFELQALDTVSNDVTLHVALIEKVVTGITVPNGQTEFKNVLRQMMPDAGGTNFQRFWNPLDKVTFSLQSGLKSFADFNKIQIVAYVQDEITKEIYQTVSLDTSYITTGLPQSGGSNMNLGISLFPNPATTEVWVVLGKVLPTDAVIQVTDQLGRVVLQEVFARGTDKRSLEIPVVESGLYYVKVFDGSGLQGVEKLFISH